MGLWDFYGLSPEESTRHMLAADQVFHLQCMFGDSDVIDVRHEAGWNSNLTIGGNHANADEHMDHYMVGVEVVVEPSTWSRIKSAIGHWLSR